MHAIDDLLIDAALSRLNDAPPAGAYSSLFLEKQAVRQMFGNRALADAMERAYGAAGAAPSAQDDDEAAE